jgi:hypothetical protein
MSLTGRTWELNAKLLSAGAGLAGAKTPPIFYIHLSMETLFP